MRFYLAIAVMMVVFAGGCAQQNTDPRVQMGEGVSQSSPVLSPITKAVSDLIGQGVKVQTVTESVNSNGFYQVDITLRNESYKTKRFQYKFEWLDENGALVPTKTSTWLPFSISGNSTATIKGVAPRSEAKNFRVVTRDKF
ncbi:putative periplasmic lipoprotein [Sedimentisphaera cyanobacteriorum]|uniref:Putative periplasmic lipoprotein n=1 Tax=Sedimentisphaera cyanobacteriorum TaxID=1940790 RepID=A0A1Q2HMJ6_9BACT|nr:YcfL family protein [Sedimentisphaera cyanobacteriorum]AQQ08511.1 putative periplasmic lipoprotein [Sedimentisphaera cyanobacteriorum]